MPKLSTEVSEPQIFDRKIDYERIVDMVAINRRSMLVHGEQGAGKTRLLQQFATAYPQVACISLESSVRNVLSALLTQIEESRQAHSLLAAKSSSLAAMTSLLDKRLTEKPWILILDQVRGSSALMTKLIKELNNYGRTPILFAGRSPHMEDIGGLRSFCYDRPARPELTPWSRPVALAFARHQAAMLQIEVLNLEETLRGIPELSTGYPGRIVEMLRMAGGGRYRASGHIKLHVLYLDYMMKGPCVV